MTEEVLDTSESLNTDETLDSNQETTEEVETNEELTKAQELAKNYKIRAEKAEKALKAKPAEKETPKNDGLSLKDVRALQNVHDDDVEKVEKWAKSEGISIAEACKDPLIQSYFKVRNEERASALASNTAPLKKGVRRDSNESILNDFEQGKVPSSDEDISRLAEAQMARKKASLKRN